MRVALVLHGKLSTWTASSSASQAKPRRCFQTAAYNRSLASAAVFARNNTWEHVVLANRRDGVDVQTYLHSWNPEAADLLDRLYEPCASCSLHEPAVAGLEQVRSQMLSLQRAISLVPSDPATAPTLVIVMRYDLLYFSSLRVGGLSSEVGLWMPQLCVPAEGMDIAKELPPFRDTCGCSPTPQKSKPCRVPQKEVGRGLLLQAPSAHDSLSRRPAALDKLHPGAWAFVMDQLFVASPRVARSFASIHDNVGQYDVWLRRLANTSNVRWPPGTMRWGHFYWAVHIEVVVAGAMRERVGFLPLMHHRDFQLLRRVWWGAFCDVEVPQAKLAAIEPHARRRLPPPAVVDALTALRVSAGFGDDPRLSSAVVATQCPESLQYGRRIACPIFSPACLQSPSHNATAQRVRDIMRRAKAPLRNDQQERSCVST